MGRVEIIERLEKLTGPSPQLDAEIAIAAGAYKLAERDGKWAIFDAPFERGKWAVASGCRSREDAIDTLSTFLSLPRYTASLDAAVALVEKMLPGWKKQFFENYSGTWIARVSSPRRDTFSTDYMRERDPDGSPNGAIALLIALLRALRSQDEEER